jgi:hypothetical protein
MTFLVTLLNPSPSHFVLSLAQRNAEERLSSLNSVSVPVSFDDLLHLLDRVRTGGKDEEDWNLRL